jgi:hypothetical protein
MLPLAFHVDLFEQLLNIVSSWVPVKWRESGTPNETANTKSCNRLWDDALSNRRQDSRRDKRNGGDLPARRRSPIAPKIGTRYCCIASCSSFLAFIMS